MSGQEGPGVKVFSIIGRMQEQRYRLAQMSDLERQWRAQFLKDQVLSHKEPRNVPELYKDTTNFMRRLWRTPMWKLQTTCSAIWGKNIGYHIRHLVGKGIGSLIVIYFVAYHFKYNVNDWTSSATIISYPRQQRVLMNDPDYKTFSNSKTEQEYYDLGFYSSPFARKIEAPKVPEPAPKVFRGGVEVACPK